MKRNTLLLMGVAILSLSIGEKGVAAEKKEVKLQAKIEEPSIRVLIAKDVRGALLEARGPYKVVDRERRELLTHEEEGKRFVIHALANGLRWGEEYPDVFSVTIEPLKSSTVLYVDGLQYKGSIHVYSGKRGAVTVINEVPIEEYVKSTIAMQLGSTLSKEALAAMSIASRTVAYAHVFHREGNQPWDISAKESGYTGMGVTMGNNGIDEAVSTTRHIVLEEGGVPLRSVAFSPDEAEKLAARGLDAKKILRNMAPKGEIGSNIPIGKEIKTLR